MVQLVLNAFVRW